MVVIGLSNPDLFSEMSPSECWLAGLIWADGCLLVRRGDQHYVALNLTDEEILADAAAMAGVSYSSQDQSHRGRQTIHRMAICGEPVRRLMRLGLERCKTATAVLPSVSHPASLVRGYFDGDGSIVNTFGYPVASFRGSYPTLDGLQEIFADAWGMNPRSNGHSHPTVGKLQLSGRDPIHLYEFMYSEEGPRLTRKHDRFLTWI